MRTCVCVCACACVRAFCVWCACVRAFCVWCACVPFVCGVRAIFLRSLIDVLILILMVHYFPSMHLSFLRWYFRTTTARSCASRIKSVDRLLGPLRRWNPGTENIRTSTPTPACDRDHRCAATAACTIATFTPPRIVTLYHSSLLKPFYNR